MKKILMTFAAVALFATAANAQISLKSLINTEALTNMATALTQQTNLSLSDLVGTWHYSKPACEFESTDLLKKAGGSLAATQVESRLRTAYAKAGISAANFSYTFKADSTFSSTLKGKVFNGRLSKNTEGKFVLQYTAVQGLMNLGAMRVYIRKSANSITIYYDADKLLKMVTYMSQFSQNATVSTLASVAGSYDGLLIGYTLTK